MISADDMFGKRIRAVIYARYSTDMQSAASVEDQVRLCQELIDRNCWKYLHAYADRAMSGASALRPQYQQLLEEARAGKFDLVVAEALDRLTRDQADVANLYKQLTFHGVKIVTLAEGEISELHVGLKGTMNALFLKDLADKTRRGLRGRIERGRSGGGLCYGYRVSQSSGEERGKRQIEEAEAEVICKIFTAFACGKSARKIAAELNRDGVRGPGGRPWGDTTIRGHAMRGTGILRNELYVGRLVWNRLRYVKDPSTGRRISRINPRESWIVRNVPELRIVDDVLWSRVQTRLDVIRSSDRVTKARATKFWTHRRPKHLLTGKVVCGVCGGPAALIGKDYFACSAARRQSTCTNRTSIRRSQVESWIIEALRNQLMAPDLVAEFVREFNNEINRVRRERGARRAGLVRDLRDIERRLNTLLDAVAAGELRGSSVRAKLEALEARQGTLAAELEGTPEEPVRLHPNLAIIYKRKVAALHELLSDDATSTEAIEIARSLIDKIKFRPGADGLEIELVGDLAGMVQLAQDPGQNRPVPAAVPDEFARSVKVVAGVGFEPTTFRL